MVDASVAKQLVQVIIDNLPAPVGKKRPVHTIGMGVKGEFVASDVARAYCIAEHFNGHPVPVSMRFSNGMGGLEQHDGWSDVRGMAVRFHLKNGTAQRSDRHDARRILRSQRRRLFQVLGNREARAVSTAALAAEDLRFSAAQVPQRNPYPGETQSIAEGALRYANQHRFSQLGIFQVASIGAPESYARASYHAVHTFWVTAPDGVRRRFASTGSLSPA